MPFPDISKEAGLNIFATGDFGSGHTGFPGIRKGLQDSEAYSIFSTGKLGFESQNDFGSPNFGNKFGDSKPGQKRFGAKNLSSMNPKSLLSRKASSRFGKFDAPNVSFKSGIKGIDSNTPTFN